MKVLQRLFRYPEIWVLTVASLVTRLWQIGWPHTIVFDEVYFRQFAADYLSGNFFFDIHPPLVKLMFAGVGSLAGLSVEQVATGDPGGTILRSVPAVAGALLVPLVYVIIRQFGLGRRIATFGALLVLLDNALLVESRFVLMDSLLLLAGLSALSVYLVVRKTGGLKRWLYVLLLALLLGVLVSIKWTGLAMAGLIAVAWVFDGIQQKTGWQRLVGEGFVTTVIIAAIYLSSFALHFALLPHSGEGDAFMTQKFQSTLMGSVYYDPAAKMSLWDKIAELNQEMYTAQSSLEGVTHPYSSRWYTWPLEVRPVYFWQGDSMPDGKQGNIYLLGNPAVWWLSLVGVIAALVIWLTQPKILGDKRRLIAFILAGYAVNFIPFTLINRPMFLYHYFFAFIFSIFALCVIVALILDWQAEKYGKKAAKQTFFALCTIVLLGFLYFLPLSYGWPMTEADIREHMWLPTWR